jgi:regulator of sigma E protease
MDGLVLSDEAASWSGHLQFVKRTSAKYCIRALTFQSLEDWGGLAGFFVTAGSVATVSFFGWVIMITVLALTNGVCNLLPIPNSNGGHLVFLAFEVLAKRRVSLRLQEILFSVGLLYTLVVFLRVAWADVVWLYGLLSA